MKKFISILMLIAIILDGKTVAEYADLIGDTPNNVSHRYRRAIKSTAAIRRIGSHISVACLKFLAK